jgi:hypothetical protein
MNEGSLKWYEMPRSQDNLNAIITRAPREMFNQNCDLLTVYAYLKDHKADTLDSVVKVVEGFAARHGSDDAHPQRRRQRRHRGRHQHRGEEGQRGDAGLVYLAVIVLAFITFRSWRR